MVPRSFWMSLVGALALGSAQAAPDGKLLLTGGVSSIDGAAGGGLTPWAVTGSYAQGDAIGLTAFASGLRTPDYRLAVAGVAAAWGERVEVSLARQQFDTGRTGTALGLPGLRLKLDIAGVKVRLAGDAVLDSDRWMPQLAVGVERKALDAGGLAGTLDALGARRDDTEPYLSATKLLLGQGVLLNGTLRWSRANQNGLLGFGGNAHPARRLLPEVSVAWLLRRDLAVGAEWRAMPDALNPSALGDGLRADDWRDLFVAWAPNKHLSVTAAWVDLGRVVPAVVPKAQRGAYLSVQLAH